MLGHVVFRLSEFAGEEKKEKLLFEGPNWSGSAPQGEPQFRLVYFVPQTEKFEIACVKGGFYIQVYHLSKKPKKNIPITDEERAKAAELIKKLNADGWRIREHAQRELRKMGEKILPLLEKEKDTPDIEVRIRIKKLIEALTPVPPGKPLSEEKMKSRTAELVGKLASYIQSNSFDCNSEPAKSLAAIGPHAVAPLERHFDSKSEHIRAAVVYALGKLKNAGSVKVILPALKNDKNEKVRFQAAGALANFDTEGIRKALKDASENDTSEKVCKQAYESLKQIESKQEPDEKEDEE